MSYRQLEFVKNKINTVYNLGFATRLFPSLYFFPSLRILYIVNPNPKCALYIAVSASQTVVFIVDRFFTIESEQILVGLRSANPEEII